MQPSICMISLPLTIHHVVLVLVLTADTRSTIDIETGDALKILWADKGKAEAELKAEVKI